MRSVASIVCAALVATANPASAQRLFARAGQVMAELDAQPDRLGRLIRLTNLPEACGDGEGRTWLLDHGRYLAWDTPGGVCLVDALGGSVRVLPELAGIVAASATSFRLVTASQGSLTLLTAPDATPQAISLPSLITPGPLGWTLWSYALAPATDSLFVLQSDFSFPSTGRSPQGPVLRRLSLPAGEVVQTTFLPAPLVIMSMAADPASDRLALVSAQAYGSTAGLYVIATTTGRLLASTSAVQPVGVGYSGPALPVTWDGDRLHVITFVTTPAAVLGLELLDAGTLRPVRPATTFMPRVPLRAGMVSSSVLLDVLVDPVSRRVLTYELERQHTRSTYSSLAVRTSLRAESTAAAPVASEVELGSLYGQAAERLLGRLFIVPPPSAPAEGTALVAARTVTLRWASSPGATHYTLEVGTAPGRADLATRQIEQPSLVVNDVPPGRYHVRLRAVGVGGQGPRSADVEIVVP